MRSLRSTTVIVSFGVLVAGTAGAALAQDGDEAAKDPAAIVADAARDLGQVKSYHLVGTLVDEDGRTKIAADVLASGNGRMSLVNGGEKAQLVALPGKLYIKGNAAFWRDTGGKDASKAVVRKLAGRWISQPAAKGDSASALLSDFRPKRLAACLASSTGTLTKAAPATVGGQPAIVLKDAGDKPGTAPSRYSFSSTAPILLLRVVQTGKAKPGRTKDRACSSSGDTTTASDIALSRFGKIGKITAPRGAVSVEEAVGGADAPSTPA